MPIRPAKNREASRTLPGDERFEARSNDRCLLAETAQLSGTDQQRVVDVERRSHMHQYASSMHTPASWASALRLGSG